MSTIGEPLDLEGFKRLTAEFLKQLPKTKTAAGVEAGLKGLMIAFVDMKVVALPDVPLAEGALAFASRKADERVREILLEPLREV